MKKSFGSFWIMKFINQIIFKAYQILENDLDTSPLSFNFIVGSLKQRTLNYHYLLVAKIQKVKLV